MFFVPQLNIELSNFTILCRYEPSGHAGCFSSWSIRSLQHLINSPQAQHVFKATWGTYMLSFYFYSSFNILVLI